ncbi:DSD1 family PLP-dependent enzyme [Pseudomaricurvus alkylphenolicus]|uniref:alanine racemase n=1 Tax=Pseudomaricurvus alkylphenolicus TaxID=1306991 RepID=UPI0014235574|nr:alanine racemase [Pseudomaricurvus alkylphenolicus]NIB38451.1 DSD1 family PLP-dependent enzyme [Pseudomaricurvus alkylphenolicus]
MKENFPCDIRQLPTPSLLLEREVMRANIQRMAERMGALNCNLRPHVKTHKSLQVLADVEKGGNTAGITVSTLQEAEYFFEGGYSNILYGVGLTPNKVEAVANLISRGCSLTVVTDNIAAINLLGERARVLGIELPVLIELDVDGHRSGVPPMGEELIDVARAIQETSGLTLQGVMTHAGGSYDCDSIDDIRHCAQQERDLAVSAAQAIRAEGLSCQVVSIGSTPTALMSNNLDGVTEIRPGVYTFLDLFQVGLGVAQLSDIAISVLTTVIGHQEEKGWVIVDAGWMAMSRDRGTEKQRLDQGYGVVCDLEGEPLMDVIMGKANQEHGIIMVRNGAAPLKPCDFPVGTMLRILPNHACATSGQYEHYCVLEGSSCTNFWRRTRGW